MIVKIQQSLGGNTVLMYDRKRTFMYEQEKTEELDRLIGEVPKAFFRARLKTDGNGGYNIEIGNRVKDKNW